ncbi:MAG: threonine-phosphate decarboxylase [Nitrospirae bacterium]|nr:threonine-phosphate decarboxylase [Nitrospirota bacterium]
MFYLEATGYGILQGASNQRYSMIESATLTLAYFLDLAIGDPRWLPHPVRITGKAITKTENFLRRIIQNTKHRPVLSEVEGTQNIDKPPLAKGGEGGFEKLAGIFLVLIIVGLTYGVFFVINLLLTSHFSLLTFIFLVYLISTTLATHELLKSAHSVTNALKADHIDNARRNLSFIVGRDTTQLSRKDILKATIETLAENASDGIIAPLFYLSIGGLPLATAYKAINTLDSMVGYKTEKYKNFGWASARLDDIANYIPARITGILIVVSTFIIAVFKCPADALRITHHASRITHHVSRITDYLSHSPMDIDREGQPATYLAVLFCRATYSPMLHSHFNNKDYVSSWIHLCSFIFICEGCFMREHGTKSTDYRLQTIDKKNLSSVFCALGSDNEHGGNIYRLAEELNMPESKVIDFSASVNPLGVSERVKAWIKKELRNLYNYPDLDAKKLRKKIAQYHDIEPETLLCGNGSTELIYLVPRAFKPEKVLIPSPTFSEYERACRMTSYKLQVTSYKLKKENNFDKNPDEFISSLVTRHSSLPFDMAFLCNPNNPTGSLLRRESVLRIAEAAKKLKCLLIVDEAFIDFHPEESVIKDTHDNPYLIVLRSMTKFYALTGLRIGYGVFSSRLINKLKEFKEPWTVNTLAQKAAMAALGDNEYIGKTLRLIKSEKDFLKGSFRKIGIEFLPSDANFYLLKIKDNTKVDLKLRGKGILVRDCSNFRGLDSTYIRVAVKSHKNNMRLMKELSRLLSSPNNPRGLNV